MTRSWDYFDTLHGRTTGVDPWRLFDLVGGEEYRRVRQAAEAASDKTWCGIFRSLQAITGWPQSRAEDLRLREEAAEQACGFPIIENVREFAPQDRIVTDTYWESDMIRRFADTIGLPPGVEIVASWDGKWSGRYWKTPDGQRTRRHIGDNPRSDVAMASAAGIQATHYTGSEWTLSERKLNDAGHWDVAGAARAARLQNPHPPNTQEAGWWDGAAASNVPFLLMAAAMVRRYADVAKPARVMFTSRDSILLGHAYARLYGGSVEVFHASRQTFRQPSPGFLKYVRRIAPGTLFVDLHGTGRTMREFSRRHGIDMAGLFVCGQTKLESHAPSLVTLSGLACGTAVEVANYHDEGRAVDVTADGTPLLAHVEYRLDAVQVHRAAALCGIAAACRPPEGVTGETLLAAAAEVTRLVPQDLLAQHQVDHPAP